jgi:alpha-galactosidase
VCITIGLGVLAGAMDNGVALTPPMGWNPWNCYANSGAGVTEDIVLAAAKSMAAKLAPAGYRYINLDCGETDACA